MPASPRRRFLPPPATLATAVRENLSSPAQDFFGNITPPGGVQHLPAGGGWHEFRSRRYAASETPATRSLVANSPTPLLHCLHLRWLPACGELPPPRARRRLQPLPRPPWRLLRLRRGGW